LLLFSPTVYARAKGFPRQPLENKLNFALDSLSQFAIIILLIAICKWNRGARERVMIEE
jgi:hypothetical protein